MRISDGRTALFLTWICALLALPVRMARAQETDNPGGLIATVRAGGAEAAWIAPKLGGTWPESDSPHPAIAPGAFSVNWAGLILVPREGKYRFSLVARGKVKLTIQGKVVIGTEAADAHPAAGAAAVTLASEWIALPAGAVALNCEFQKSAKDARLQMFWESDDFGLVPVPATVLAHDAAAETPALTALAAAERGRFIFEKQRCGSCHSRSDAAPALPSPDLTFAGSRLKSQWVFEYLKDPGSHRDGTEMPSYFEAGDASAAARADLARYYESLRDPKKLAESKHSPNAENGKKAFAMRGCVACHNSPEGANTPETMPRAELFATGSKFTDERVLADFIQRPLEAHPAGTMPELRLSREECLDIAAFLMKARDPNYEKALPALAAGDTLEMSQKRGMQLSRERGCVICHKTGAEAAPAPAAPSFEAGLKSKNKDSGGNIIAGCARGAAAHGFAPEYHLNDSELQDLTAYLTRPANAHKPAAMAYEVPRILDRFGCLQCHVRDGRGGGLAELQKVALGEGHEQEIEQVAPPDLSGVGTKLRPEWIREMFVSHTRARPWLQVRMPHFGAGIEILTKAFAAEDGEELESPLNVDHRNPAVGTIGQDLIGKKGFNCTACHDLAGWEASVAFVDARGPDLTLAPGRVRESWFRRWLFDPQALVPGTKMPTFFPGGKSTLPGRHGLDADGQARALYNYLALGNKAPLPAGLANNNGWSWIPEGRPALIRTPFDEAPRTICIGFPGGVSIAYDAALGRLYKTWEGGFLRMNGTQWTGQHGPYPTPEGSVLWTGDAKAGLWQFDGAPDARPVYRGYKEKNGNFTFETEFATSGGAISIAERFVAGPSPVEGGGAQVDRYIHIRGLAAGQSLLCDIYRNKGAAPRAFHFLAKVLDGKASVSTSTTNSGSGVIYTLQITPSQDGEVTVLASMQWAATPNGEALADPSSNAKTDAFAEAPLVPPGFEGDPPPPDHPLAAEAASYPTEGIPVPEETVLQGGGLDFLPDGSLAICTRRGEVWILENATKDASMHKWRRFAHGLHEPLGLKVVNREIYVLQKPELTKLVDSDKDGFADHYICYNAGWELSTNFHEFAFGLEYYKGAFYGTLGLAIVPGGATRQEQVFARGSAWRVTNDRQFEVLALGLRTPNGTGMGPNGEFYYSDNQGDYIPACKLVEVKKDEFYGQRFALKDRNAQVTVTPPVCWFPYGKMSQSSSDILYEDRAGKFGPFAGQLICAELTNSQLMRVQLETVKGRQQGTCWVFRRGFTSGVERICWGPDDKLYIAQTTGGWGAVGPKLFALERVAYSGKVPFEMKTVHLLKDGFEIEFTKPVKANTGAADAVAATVEQFHYHYWATYGSPEIDRKPCKVTSTTWNEAHTKLTLKVDEMVTDRICEIRLRNVVAADDGEKLLHPEAWYTLNEFPE